jgi:hypothetical protein
MRKTEQLVKKYLLEFSEPPAADCDARVLADTLAAMLKTKPRQASFSLGPGARIVGSGAARLAAGIVVVVLIVSFAVRFSRPVWALDQVIDAMKRHKACNLTMIDPTGVVFDMWAKAEPSGEVSGELTMRGSNGTIIWVKDNRTYFYNPHSNVVEVDDAKTAGFMPWLGPELMRLIAKADDARTSFGKDPRSGRDLVVMTGSMTATTGRVSFSFEFDRQTRLPVAYKQWNNPRRSGAPSLSVVRIVYHEDIPEGFLPVSVPESAIFTQKPIILPEENLALLGDPGHGISAEGLTRDQASRSILEQVYKASIAGDLATIRRLCPVTAAWSDELIRAIILNEDEGRRLAEVVSIGAISREGYNRLGPFVVVPTRLKTRDGRLWDEKQIVQFRQIVGRDSCVVYGPYGMLSEVK